MNQLKNIIVTGSNKGIGYGIVNHLAQSSNWNIIMACRNVELAQKAKSQILAKHPESKIHVEQLDVSDTKSIEAFIPLIKEKYHHIDVLTNNAGVGPKNEVFDIQAFNYVFSPNFYGPIDLSEKIIPLLNENGKIVTIGSSLGKMAFNGLKNEDIKKRFQNPNLTKEELFKLIEEYKEVIVKDEVEKKGWLKQLYAISKLGINVYSTILSRNQQILKKGIQVYSCCPGYVATDLTNNQGFLTVQQGIKTPIYLIQLPFKINKEIQGGFFQKQKLSSTFQPYQ